MNRLKELREDNDIYQKDIAKYLNVDQSNYSKYELEKINIPVVILKKLADYYDTTIDYLKLSYFIIPLFRHHYYE